MSSVWESKSCWANKYDIDSQHHDIQSKNDGQNKEVKVSKKTFPDRGSEVAEYIIDMRTN